MAADIRIFPSGIPQSERSREEAAERRRKAEELRAQLLDRTHTSEIFGSASASFGDPSDLMPTPDVVARKFAAGKGYDIYPQMRRNVLKYGALQSTLPDLLFLHRITWLPGKKGDPAAEQAKEEMESAWSNLEDAEVLTAMHAVVDDGGECGFAGAENVWGVHARGKARDLIFPVQVINRPVSWFGFDWTNRPIFMPTYRRGRVPTNQPFSDYKVSFIRMGSIHTKYGKGTGQDCYPCVYIIDAALKGYLQAAERFSYPLIAATYPQEWANTKKQTDFEYNLYRTYKNFLSFPGDVDKPELEIVGRGVESGGFTGNAQMKLIELSEGWLSHYLTGGMLTNSNTTGGSFAREKTHAGLPMDKIAPRASAAEAFINRGITKPAMLVNHPELDESLWPRAVFDIAPNEDLAALRESVEQGVKMKFPISQTWWSETFKIPAAQAGEPTLVESAEPLYGFEAAQASGNAANAAARFMSEQDSVICVRDKNGNILRFNPNETVATENRGWVRAATLTSADELVVHKARVLESRG